MDPRLRRLSLAPVDRRAAGVGGAPPRLGSWTASKGWSLPGRPATAACSPPCRPTAGALCRGRCAPTWWACCRRPARPRAGLLGNGLAALAREPGLRRKIGDQLTLMPLLVAEVARHDPAVHNTRRFVAAPTTVAGQALAPGDAVLLVLAAANRDPALNPAPATFELMRTDRRCLGFGHGRHARLGAGAGRHLAAAGLQALLAEGLDTDALLRRGWHYRPLGQRADPRLH